MVFQLLVPVVFFVGEGGRAGSEESKEAARPPLEASNATYLLLPEIMTLLAWLPRKASWVRGGRTYVPKLADKGGGVRRGLKGLGRKGVLGKISGWFRFCMGNVMTYACLLENSTSLKRSPICLGK